MPDPGRLLVCATPIGNLADVTLRVLEALRGADAVLAEDTRVTRRLLARYDIATPLERYDEHVAERATPSIIERLRAGAVLALVSDAGMPGVSDPGQRLVDAALRSGVRVEVLPGPSAITAALVASGFVSGSFFFGGFLPRRAGERARLLASLAPLDAVLVFFESPKRTASALAALAEAFPEREGALVRELTKVHEEVVRAPLPELAAAIAERGSLKGEVVLVVGPPSSEGAAGPEVDPAAIRASVERLVEQGVSRSDAVREVAARLGLARSVVYEHAHRGPKRGSSERGS